MDQMELTASAAGAAIFVGIEVSKATLDVALRPSGEQWDSANDEAGIAELVERLRPLGPQLIVLEATGGLERLTRRRAGAGWTASGGGQSAPGARRGPRPPDSSPRPTRWMRRRWMRRRWRPSPRRSVRSRAHCPTRRARRSRLWSNGVTRSWAC
jgi:hypothetical protein